MNHPLTWRKKRPLLVAIAIFTALVLSVPAIALFTGAEEQTPPDGEATAWIEETTTSSSTTSSSTTTTPPTTTEAPAPPTPEPVTSKDSGFPPSDEEAKPESLNETPSLGPVIGTDAYGWHPARLDIPDGYWDRMAYCETEGNWEHYPGARWSGGLGIYTPGWHQFGGGEFAPSGGEASREQQIVVANRIAAEGLGGWGCLTTIGYP